MLPRNLIHSPSAHVLTYMTGTLKAMIIHTLHKILLESLKMSTTRMLKNSITHYCLMISAIVAFCEELAVNKHFVGS